VENKYRPSSLIERKEFYEKEFDIGKVKRWFRANGMQVPQICAVDAGTETGIIIDRKLKGEMLYFKFDELLDKIKKYVPEDVYYDRNRYENPDKVLKELKFQGWERQELAFDIDSDNVECNCKNREKLCDSCIEKTFDWTKKMKKELEKDFRNMRIVYSGRGFHLHVLDKKAFFLTKEERRELNKRFKEYPIDAWVSAGNIRLIRMPYSLNALVSRKVIPIRDNFDMGKAYPKFLKN